MKRLFFLLLLSSAFLPSMAQPVLRCGQKMLHEEWQQQNPGFDQWLLTEKRQTAQKAIHGNANQAQLMKTTTASPIPVIFHIIVDTNQYIQLGSNAGIAERVRSQLQTLNADYNGLNTDRSKTPSVWVPVLGSPDISFASARVDPAGNYTPGHDVRIVPNGTSFSALDAAKSAKFAASGGTDAWDPKRYLNIWVTNISISGSTVLGITAPPAFAGFTEPEYGVALNYKVFGARTSPSQYFLTPFDHGRTLTHEIGHFFYIWHPSGDDDGTCDGDDGLSDTPPEADNCTGSPAFPRFDICSPDGNGIMFMNFMDYTNDTALYMFTKQQVAVMQSEVSLGGRSHSLTLNPHLSDTQLSPPDRVTIGPNPSNGFIYLFYNPAKVSIQSLSVWNIMGQKLIESTEPGIASIDLSALSKGVYFVRCTYNNQVTQEKIILQ